MYMLLPHLTKLPNQCHFCRVFVEQRGHIGLQAVCAHILQYTKQVPHLCSKTHRLAAMPRTFSTPPYAQPDTSGRICTQTAKSV